MDRSRSGHERKHGDVHRFLWLQFQQCRALFGGGEMTQQERDLAAKIIADYKEHYDFPAQGESHMHDCIMDALDGLAAERARVAGSVPHIDSLEIELRAANAKIALNEVEFDRLKTVIARGANNVQDLHNELREANDRLREVDRALDDVDYSGFYEQGIYTLKKSLVAANAKLVEAEQKLEEIEAWKEKAFEAHPNLDLDMEYRR